MNRAWYYNIDWWVVGAWVLLVCIGLTAIYSATHSQSQEFLLQSVQQNFTKQVMWFGVSAVGVIILLLLPAPFLERMAYPAYIITTGMLVVLSAMTLVGAAREINGATSWLQIGPVGIQVSEIAKVGTILAAARILSHKEARQGKFRYLVLGALAVLIPAVLIVQQNDTGTALVFLALIPVLWFWSGNVPLPWMALMMAPAVAAYLAIINMTWALIFAAVFVVGIAVATRSRWMTALGVAATAVVSLGASFALNQVLQPHQQARIQAFLNPEQFASSDGYHLIQARAAIGAGGLTGRGFREGTQTQLAFIPEQSTDFIFSVIGEEWGFIGSMVMLGLLAFLIIRLCVMANQSGYAFPKLVCAGTAGIFLVHTFINVGMTVGVLPVIGIPLPFISYGGSALLANTTLVGLALALHARRHEFGIYGS